MSVQRRSISAVAPFARPKLPDAYSTVILFALAAPPTLFLALVRPSLMLPLTSVVSLAGAAAVAFVAWWTSAERNTIRINLWDLAGAYAFIGFAAGMLSDPQDVMEIWASPANLPEGVR